MAGPITQYQWKGDGPYYGSGGTGTNYERWFKYIANSGDRGVKGSGHSKRLFWNWQKSMGYDGGGVDPSAADSDRFAARYYAGTFDEELNKLAVDTTTLWQGYYPSLYNPHTQGAAGHLPAPGQPRIDPLTGEYIVEPATPTPEPGPAQIPPTPPGKIPATGGTGTDYERWFNYKDGSDKGIFNSPYSKRLFWGWQASMGYGGADAPAPAPVTPVVNPDGTLVPWNWSNWVISMGQWRGT